jgi:dehydrogenase/reductase SDR family member 12
MLNRKVQDYLFWSSFDKKGFLRHQKDFSGPSLPDSLEDKTFLVTGATSGIGLEIAYQFAMRKANLILICRNQIKMQKIIKGWNKEISDLKVTTLYTDLSDFDNLKTQISKIKKNILIDSVILNAGTMPLDLEFNIHDVELTFASHVLGHCILIDQLINKKLMNENGRFIWMTSGGMFFKKLKMNEVNFENCKYDKFKAYSNAKRAQVILNQELSNKYKNFTFLATHPGWVDTPSVRSSMPVFYKVTKKNLRSTLEGADTALWLSSVHEDKVKSGTFWFDRLEKDIYFFPLTKETKEERQSLVEYVNTFTS